jgi:hypothetical protein
MYLIDTIQAQYWHIILSGFEWEYLIIDTKRKKKNNKNKNEPV